MLPVVNLLMVDITERRSDAAKPPPCAVKRLAAVYCQFTANKTRILVLSGAFGCMIGCY
jgi:hypothetical protein